MLTFSICLGIGIVLAFLYLRYGFHTIVHPPYTYIMVAVIIVASFFLPTIKKKIINLIKKERDGD